MTKTEMELVGRLTRVKQRKETNHTMRLFAAILNLASVVAFAGAFFFKGGVMLGLTAIYLAVQVVLLVAAQR